MQAIDSFGNLLCGFDTYDHNNMLSIAKRHESNKAVVFYACPLDAVLEYNAIAEDSLKAEVIHTYDDGNTVCLVRKESCCPRLINGEIIAGGVNVLVNHEDNLYTLLMQDKTKKYLTVPGGTANLSDISDNYIETGINVGAREFYEETGVELGKVDLLAELHFDNTYFNVPVKDTYIMGKHYIKDSHPYLEKLFHKDNKKSDGLYSLPYNNNKETEFIHAVQLNKTFPNFRYYHHHISKLHLYLSQVHAVQHNGRILPENVTMMKIFKNVVCK